METAHTLDRAQRMLRVSPRSAIDLIRSVLSEDPESADAHALMSFALRRTKRIYAAEHEAREAIRLEPNRSRGYHALGLALIAQRRARQAEEALRQAVTLSPEWADHQVALAQVALLRGDRQKALGLLRRAVELDPEDAENLAALGSLLVDLGQLDEAERIAADAHALEPDTNEVLVLKGHLALRRGRVEEATELALWAIRENPTGTGPLHLLASIKARQSLFLGLWWRYVVFMVARGEVGQIVTLLGAYLTVQVSAQLADDFGAPDAASIIRMGWLVLVLYSFSAPGFFRRMIDKELQAVRLRKDF